MIARLSGTVVHLSGNTLVLDVVGVGYELTVTSRARELIEKNGGETKNIDLIVYTDVKENSIALFGFQDFLEREVFLLLKKVKGVGSRLALAVISCLGAEGLLHAIGSDEVTLLTRVPGVGKKTANRMIMELAEHVGNLVLQTEGTLPLAASVKKTFPAAPESSLEWDAILALEKLGFSKERAKQAVDVTLEKSQGNVGDAGELLKQALVNL